MTTRLLTDTDEAAQILREGGLVAIPTETVFGLAARADNDAAIARLFEAKGRPQDNPLIVHIADTDQLSALCSHVPDYAHQLAATWWPGPLTMVLPAVPEVSRVITAGLDTVGIRIPDHVDTRQILRSVGVPVAAPSANRSGRPSPTTWNAVFDDLDGRIDAVFKSGPTAVGVESTVVDCTRDAPVILRPGGVSLADIQAIHPDARMRMATDDAERSPGTRYRHYQPEARVQWVGPFDGSGSERQSDQASTAGSCAYIGLNTPPEHMAYVRQEVVTSLDAYAQKLFQFFRDCEQAGIREIHCERVTTEGLGLALHDRISRAIG
ncbi:MAG: L-threonylcarbamoyladenylate synthase [Rhodothermales bacterium]